MYHNYQDRQMSYREKQAQLKKQIIRGSLLAIIFITVISVFFSSFTIVKPGYHGVKYAFGTLQEEEVGQGWSWHFPWEDIQPYATSTEVEKRLYVVDDNGKVLDDNTIQLNTGDGKSVKVAFTYNYKFEPDKLDHIFTKFRRKTGPEIADQYIDQQIINRGQAISTQHSVLQVYSQKRGEINATWFEILREDLRKDGIILEEFTIVDVIPDAKTLEILQQVADEENNRELVIRQRNTLKEQEQNIAQQNANDLLAAQGAKEVAIIKAQEKAERITIEARAQAEANNDLEKSLTPSLVQYEWILAWKAGGSQVPKISGDSNAFIQVPESFFGDE